MPDELGVGADITTSSAPAPADTHFVPQTGLEIPDTPPEPEKVPEVVALTPEQEFAQACAVICPIKKHGGKTLGEVLQMDPRAINWLADNYSRHETVRAAANFIRAYSLE